MVDRNFPPRVCAEEGCGLSFTPTGPGQKYCEEHRVGGWARANAARNRETGRRKMRRRRGLRDFGDEYLYDRLVAVYGDVCRICGEPPAKPYGLAIDHDHESGAVRGLLCKGHNAGLGYFQDRPDLLRSAAEYLEVDRSDLPDLLAAVEIEEDKPWDRHISGWARLFDRCQNPNCETPEAPHRSRGFCTTCYPGMIYAERKERGYQRTDRPVRSEEEIRATRAEAARKAAARRSDEEKAAISEALSAARVGNRRVYDEDGSWHYEKLADGPFVCAECGATDRPHRARGLCARCYDRSRRKQEGQES